MLENIYDYDKNKLKDIGFTLEKGKKYRYFTISRDKDLLYAFNNYFNKYPHIVKDKNYLFPSKYIGSSKPLNYVTIDKTIKPSINAKRGLDSILSTYSRFTD